MGTCRLFQTPAAINDLDVDFCNLVKISASLRSNFVRNAIFPFDEVNVILSRPVIGIISVDLKEDTLGGGQLVTRKR